MRFNIDVALTVDVTSMMRFTRALMTSDSDNLRDAIEVVDFDFDVHQS